MSRTEKFFVPSARLKAKREPIASNIDSRITSPHIPWREGVSRGRSVNKVRRTMLKSVRDSRRLRTKVDTRSRRCPDGVTHRHRDETVKCHANARLRTSPERRPNIPRNCRDLRPLVGSAWFDHQRLRSRLGEDRFSRYRSYNLHRRSVFVGFENEKCRRGLRRRDVNVQPSEVPKCEIRPAKVEFR